MAHKEWQCEQRCAAREYHDPIERDAFRAGYSDGWYGARFDAGDWPNAYGAGYNEGRADAHPENIEQ